MRETYMTTLPDRVGAFLKAAQCISPLGLNITRVSYNKAVDVHTLFLEVEGDAAQLELARKELDALGYFQEKRQARSVILLELTLKDEPQALMPIIRLIHNYMFNISYMSSQADGSGFQKMKIGLLVENEAAISDFMRKASLLCPIRIMEYNQSERVLDNTVFYISFSNEIAEKMGLDETAKSAMVVNANHIMQTLEDYNRQPYMTFDYIGRFADQILKYRGDGYKAARVSEMTTASDRRMILCEPPCGSNTCVIYGDDALIFVDSGYACFHEQLTELLEPYLKTVPEGWKRSLLITHSDNDHCAEADTYDTVYLSENSLLNFTLENEEDVAVREWNLLHAPYIRICKLLTRYRKQNTERFVSVGKRSTEDMALLSYIGSFETGGLRFEAYEGRGGHILGETIFIERTERLAFTGDIYVNIKGMSPEQRAFNIIAPSLMTAVDTDPALAKEERNEFFKLLDPGTWTVIPGHGAPMQITLHKDGAWTIS